MAAEAVERRVDPDDGVAYTFVEFARKCKGHFSDVEVREYWCDGMPVVLYDQDGGSSGSRARRVENRMDTSEVRTDPEDGVIYTWDSFKEANLRKFSLEELIEYWFDDMLVDDSSEVKTGESTRRILFPPVLASIPEALGNTQDSRAESGIDLNEIRLDPEDEESYTWRAFKEAKLKDFSLDELVGYWFEDMRVELLEGTKVIVSNMAKETTDLELTDAFSKAGEISYCQIFYNDREESKGFAKLQFASHASAEMAVRELNGMELGGRELVVRVLPDERGASGRTPPSVFVGALRLDTEQHTIEEAFGTIGEVTSVQLFSGASSGQAKVEFLFEESVARAVNMFHLKGIDGKTVCCTPWQEKVDPATGRRSRKLGPSVCVARLSPWTTAKSIRQLFDSVPGMTVCDVRIVMDRATMESRGFAHVELGDDEVVALTVDQCDGVLLDGSRITVLPFVDGKPPLFPSVCCRNLSGNVTAEVLKEIFAEVGCHGARILLDRTSGASRGLGFVQFFDEPSARAAAARYNGEWLDGRQLYCSFAKQERVSGDVHDVGKGGKNGKGIGESRREESMGDSHSVSQLSSGAERGWSPTPAGVGHAFDSFCNGQEKGGGGGKGSLGEADCSVFVSNLGTGTTEERLQEHFSSIGEVVYCGVLIDREIGVSKGVGRVAFNDTRAQQRAIAELDDSELDGQRILIREFHAAGAQKGSGKGVERSSHCLAGTVEAADQDVLGGRGSNFSVKESAVFVGGLDRSTTREDLQQHFGIVAAVTYCSIVVDRETGEPRGFGKVCFATEEGRRRAIEELNYSELGGRRIGVREFGTTSGAGKGAGKGSAGKSGTSFFPVFVGGLDRSTTQAALHRHFSDVGEVAYCSIMADRETGESRCSGRVCFTSEETRRRAVEEWNDSELDGKRIVVREFGVFADKGQRAEGIGKGWEGNGPCKNGPNEFAVFVAGLAKCTTADVLRKHFVEVAEISHCGIMIDGETKESKCVGKVCFNSEDAKHRAIQECNDSELDGRRIAVREFGAAPGRGRGGQDVGRGRDGKGDGKNGAREFAVFVAGFSKSTTREALSQHFAGVGEVVHCGVMADRETGESKCLGKVCFRTVKEQQRAIEEGNDSELDGRRILVREFAIGGNGKGTNMGGSSGVAQAVFVGGLAKVTTAEDLQRHFEDAGEVSQCIIFVDQEVGESRGFGRVCFTTEDAKALAVQEWNGSELDGRILTVREYTQVGSGARGGSRSSSPQGARGASLGHAKGRMKGTEEESGARIGSGGVADEPRAAKGCAPYGGPEAEWGDGHGANHFQPEATDLASVRRLDAAEAERGGRVGVRRAYSDELGGSIARVAGGAEHARGGGGTRGAAYFETKGMEIGKGKNDAERFHSHRSHAVEGGLVGGANGELGGGNHGAGRFKAEGPLVVDDRAVGGPEDPWSGWNCGTGAGRLRAEVNGKFNGKGNVGMLNGGAEAHGKGPLNVPNGGVGSRAGPPSPPAPPPPTTPAPAVVPSGAAVAAATAQHLASVFVEGLGAATTAEALRRHLGAAGEVLYCKVVPVDDSSSEAASAPGGKGKGKGKVCFATEEARRRAVELCSGSELDGCKILVRDFGPVGGGLGAVVAGFGATRQSEVTPADSAFARGARGEGAESPEVQPGGVGGGAGAGGGGGWGKGLGSKSDSRVADSVFAGVAPAIGSGGVGGTVAGGKVGSKGAKGNSTFSLFVGGLDKSTTPERLREHFEGIGELTSCHIIFDRDIGESKCVAKIAFATEEYRRRALAERHGSRLDGSRIVVREFGSPSKTPAG